MKIEAALGVYRLARTESSLHHASIYRVHAAIALERRRLDEAAQYVKMQMIQLELHGKEEGYALEKSGLFDRAPDGVGLSPWGLDVPPGNFVVLPFRSIRSFGWKLYLHAQDERDPKYAQYLQQAELCFSTALRDRTGFNAEAGQSDLRYASDIKLDGPAADQPSAAQESSSMALETSSRSRRLFSARPNRPRARRTTRTPYYTSKVPFATPIRRLGKPKHITSWPYTT